LTTATLATAQTNYDYQQLKREQLNRGVVAVRTADGKVAVSWRTLRSDAKGQAYDVYRDGVKLNREPLTTGGTFFIDEQPLNTNATYEVRTPQQPAGSFRLQASSPIGYLPIPIRKPEGRYTANDASVGDVDGDGQYEIFLKWEPWNAHDNAHDGYTDPVFIDCYRLDGTQLWRIDLGRNIRAGAHYTQFMVYDFDGDGRAEMMCRTADGTRDGQGRVMGDSLADYRNPAGHILEGPEFLTVFDGLTGRAMDTKPYIPQRGDVTSWGDNKANRSDRFLAAVGYLGNETYKTNGAHSPQQTASAIFCRGYYTRTVIAAWDWDGRELKSRWTFDTNEPQWRSYAGQGNHNLRIADVDGDGLDEITYGSMAVDNDGRGLYNTRMGHGDAIHLVADPKTNELFIWDCHENRRDGSELRNARTGEIVFQIKSSDDVGRCMAADIDPTSYGCEMWSSDSHGIRTMTGEQLTETRISINFGIWWDGDLLRELLDRSAVTKYDWENRQVVELQRLDGQFNNGTKSNPCLSADLLGDWREEVLTRNRESTELRLYVTTIPTGYRINCLMEDIPYRLSVATQNVAYNQPPEPGFYIGPDGTDYLK
jgi:rhamnogalacturonan endolyase